MLSIYNLFMKPIERLGVNRNREMLVKEAKGNVLELGVGTGANLPFYNYNSISGITLSDMSKSKHLDMKRSNVKFVESNVEELPFSDNSFDTVVFTLLFCSVKNVSKGLSEIKRVLKPEGKVIFIEHVLPEKKSLRKTFKLINPLWKTMSRSCQLTKDFRSSLLNNGFKIEKENVFGNTVFLSGIASLNNHIL